MASKYEIRMEKGDRRMDVIETVTGEEKDAVECARRCWCGSLTEVWMVNEKYPRTNACWKKLSDGTEMYQTDYP